MKINIAVNKNGFYDIELKIANTTKRIYNASEINIFSKKNKIYIK